MSTCFNNTIDLIERKPLTVIITFKYEQTNPHKDSSKKNL